MVKKFITRELAASFFLLTGSAVFALEVDYPEIGGIELNAITQNIFPVYLKYIFNFSLAIAGMLALGILIYSGFRYMTAGGSVSAMQEIKQRIASALLGLLILFGSYLILTTINPQLTFFDFPELAKLAPPPKVPDVAIDGDKILNYTELPISGIAAEALKEERMDGVKKTMVEVQEKSEELKKKSEELLEPIKSSSCGPLSPECGPGGCEGGICAGNPCPRQPEIERIRAELFSLLDEQPEKINYWLEMIGVEVSDLKKLLGDLESAENKTKQCVANPVNAQGQRQKLLNDSYFWEYYETLLKQEKITKADGEFPFPYTPKSQNPYDSATFYCAEDMNSIPLPILKFDEDALKSAASKAVPIKSKATSCGNELRLGQAIDDAELLLEEIIKRLEELTAEIQKEISLVGSLLATTDPAQACKSSRCSPASSCYIQCIACPEESDEEEELPAPSSWFKIFLKEALAQGCDCGEVCIPATGPCSGRIFDNKGTEDLIEEIGDSKERIDGLTKDLVDLIGEKLKDKIKISEILKKIKTSDSVMSGCFDSREEQAQIMRGEKRTRDIINSCSFIKKFDQSEVKCYGPDPNNLLEDKKFDNFFCCQTETGF